MQDSLAFSLFETKNIFNVIWSGVKDAVSSLLFRYRKTNTPFWKILSEDLSHIIKFYQFWIWYYFYEKKKSAYWPTQLQKLGSGSAWSGKQRIFKGWPNVNYFFLSFIILIHIFLLFWHKTSDMTCCYFSLYF